MFMIVFSIVVSLALAGALLWYVIAFLQDIEPFLQSKTGLSAAQFLPFTIIGVVLICVLNGLAIYFGWAIFFLIMTLLLGAAQLLCHESLSKLAVAVLIAGQIPAAFITIRGDVVAGHMDWLYWIFAVVLFPLIEVAAYTLLSFISAETDKRRSRRS